MQRCLHWNELLGITSPRCVCVCVCVGSPEMSLSGNSSLVWLTEAQQHSGKQRGDASLPPTKEQCCRAPQLLGRKGSISCTTPDHNSSRQEIEAGAKAEVIEELITGLFPCPSSVAFSNHPRSLCPGVASPAVGWALLHQENVPQICLQASLGQVIL